MKTKNIFLLAAASFALAFGTSLYLKHHYDKQIEKIRDHKETIEIKVQKPELDTWWEIAKRYGPEGTGKEIDVRYVVDYLKKINNKKTDLLYENQTVKVPKYEKLKNE